METPLDVSSGLEVPFDIVYSRLAGFLDRTKIDNVTAVLVLLLKVPLAIFSTLGSIILHSILHSAAPEYFLGFPSGEHLLETLVKLHITRHQNRTLSTWFYIDF